MESYQRGISCRSFDLLHSSCLSSSADIQIIESVVSSNHRKLASYMAKEVLSPLTYHENQGIIYAYCVRRFQKLFHKKRVIKVK